MKKFIFLLFITTSAFFAGCDSNKPKDLIVNQWRITDIDVPGMPLDDSSKATLMKGTMEFTKDGKLKMSGLGNNQSGTYTLSDDGKTVFVVINGKTESNEIVELSKTKMVMFDKLNNSKLSLAPR